MTAVQRRSLAAVTAVLVALTAGLIALSVTGAAPRTPRLLSNVSQHHATVPGSVRELGPQHGSSADLALCLPSLLVLGLLGFLGRRPRPDRLTAAVLARPSARGPPNRR